MLRVLKFIVEGQTIKPDPFCDFSGLVPGTNGYVRVEFSFSSEWRELTKVVAFYSAMGKELPPRRLTDDKACLIPMEALKGRVFKLRVIGKNKDVTLQTDKFAVKQKGDK